MVQKTQKFVSYLRVSTARQGQSGLGIEAQRSSVTNYLNGGSWRLVGEFVEVESGKNNNRPELQKALSACRIHNATLVVARLDRLARNAHFLLGLKEAGVDFVCVDMPAANALTIGIMAMVAQEEARLISARTKAALAQAKARGVILGSPKPITRSTQVMGARQSAVVRSANATRWMTDVKPIVERAVREMGTLRAAAGYLTLTGVPARRGGMWSATQVMRVMRTA
jgi:DNA invertase Pin-like site-specific DNA recombinase